VAVEIVEGLEMVDIDHDDADGFLFPGRARDFTLKILFHVPPVEQPGQRIPDGLVAEVFPEPDVRQRQGQHLGQRRGDVLPGPLRPGRVPSYLLRPVPDVKQAKNVSLGHQRQADVSSRGGMLQMRTEEAADLVDHEDNATAQPPAGLEPLNARTCGLSPPRRLPSTSAPLLTASAGLSSC
jgi:hypothetical protein